jgi:hypothetical protein
VAVWFRACCIRFRSYSSRSIAELTWLRGLGCILWFWMYLYYLYRDSVMFVLQVISFGNFFSLAISSVLYASMGESDSLTFSALVTYSNVQTDCFIAFTASI